MHVTVKQRLTQLGSIIDRWWLIGLASLVASYLALDVAQNVLAEWSPRALDVAEAALISLGALAALIFLRLYDPPARKRSESALLLPCCSAD